MSDSKNEPTIDLGIYAPSDRPPKLPPTEMIAVVLSVAWIVAIGGFLLVMRRDPADPLAPVRFVMTLMAIFLPVAMIWVAAAAAKASRVMRDELARLKAAVDAMRQSYIAHQHQDAVKPSVEQKLEEIAAAQRKTEHAIATFSSVRHQLYPEASAQPAMPAPEEPPEEQGDLALATPADAQTEPVEVADFIRALNFPESADDQEGFRALRRSLRDRQTSQLVQAAQDVLTLLSQDGIFMDDLRPDRARPEIWRRFAQGERGRAIAPLGGVRDRSALALSAGRMRSDSGFRELVHNFLRRFDQIFAQFETVASDQDIAALADTRTARAFMLVGRVSGTFD